MADPILAFPNHLDSDYINVTIGGGNWELNLPLENLKQDAFHLSTQSINTDLQSTQFFVDMGAPRGVRMFGFPFHNLDLSGKYRVRAMAQPKFRDAQVGSTADLGSTSFFLEATEDSVVLSRGDIISFLGQDQIYKIVNPVTVQGGVTGLVSIDPPLVDDIELEQPIKCHVGDPSQTLYDTGVLDAIGEVYPFGSIDFTHPSWFTGKPTVEQVKNKKFPILKVFSLIIPRFWHFEFFNEDNADGYLRFPRLFIAPGYQATTGLAYGARHEFETETRVDKTLGSRRIYGVEPTVRKLVASLDKLEIDEAMANLFDLATEAGIHKQLFFVFDPDDTTLMHRRAFLATFERPSALDYPYFNLMDTSMEIREVVA